jgi:hypothetical protein
MKTLVTSILAFLFISIKLLVAQSAPYIEFDSPTALETITGITSADQIPLTLEFTYAKDPAALRTEYIKLITHDSVYQGFLGNGIPSNWNLESGTYTWNLKQYDYFHSLNDTIPTCSTSVVFVVKNTIEFETDPGGYIIVTGDGAKSQGDQVYRKTDSYLTIKAPDQIIDGDYYIWVNVWDNNGLDPSEWEITKYGTASTTQLSQSYQYTYKVESDDNGAIIKDYLRYEPVSTPSISMSGGWGDNPTLTFSGGGGNVDHYVLKKEYDFGSGYGTPGYVTTSSNSYTDPNVERDKFGDLVARYSVKVVDRLGNESSYSSTVSTNGQSLWKNGSTDQEEVINEYALNVNYPNPFNPTTQISYQLPESGNVNLIVYNSLGEEVATLINSFQSSGKHSVQFDASDLPSGVYIYRLSSKNFTSTKKMLLTK